MADLHKRVDREDWLTWAIEFMRRGLWLDEEITVHGPHDASCVMWGDALAFTDGDQYGVECSFRASGKRNKYRPTRIRICDEEHQPFTVRRVSDLTPKAQRWLRAAKSTKRKLTAAKNRAARIALERNSRRF